MVMGGDCVVKSVHSYFIFSIYYLGKSLTYSAQVTSSVL